MRNCFERLLLMISSSLSDRESSPIFSNRNRSPTLNGKDVRKRSIDISLRRGQISSSFKQSRRFQIDQVVRDSRDLGQPTSYAMPISNSYYFTFGGPGDILGISTQEACRLTNSFCARDYQCCSGKCRCVKWSITGRTSCWKKCY